MKKAFSIIIASFALLVATPSALALGPASATAIAKVVVDAVGGAIDAIPNASYELLIEDPDGKYSTVSVDTANKAINGAIVALSNGAKTVTISSSLPTVHPSCRNKTYTKSDISHLKSRL